MIIRIEIAIPKGNKKMRAIYNDWINEMLLFIKATKDDSTIKVEKSFEDE